MTEVQLKAIRDAAIAVQAVDGFEEPEKFDHLFHQYGIETRPEVMFKLLDEIEALRKDAERYRWIASDPYHDGYAWWTQDICILESDDSNLPPTKEQVDAAIDAIMDGLK